MTMSIRKKFVLDKQVALSCQFYKSEYTKNNFNEIKKTLDLKCFVATNFS